MTKNIFKRGSTYCFRAQVHGRDIWKSLDTSDIQIARQRARKLREKLRSEKWEEVLGDLQPRAWSTLSEVFAAYQDYSITADIAPRTVRENIACLRRIIRTVHGQTYDVDAARASILNGRLMRDYQAAKIAAAKAEGPLALNRAKSTSYSTAGQARSIFARECLQSRAYRSLSLPDLSDFLQARLRNKERTLLRPPAPELITATTKAAGTLRESAPGRWLAFILCSNLGLRRKEAISARWDWVEEVEVHGEKAAPDGAMQTVQTTCYVMSVIKRDDFDPKGSERVISIHPEVWTAMLAARVSIDTIVPGTPAERLQACQHNVAWLRSLGWDARLPNHALRALFASRIASEHGLFAAQSALGHGDPRTTTTHYATWLGLDKVTKVF